VVRFVRSDESAHGSVVLQLHGLDGVTGYETVLANHERKADIRVLGDAGGHDKVVVGFLVVFAVKLDPA
jgi:hypothetical protein